MTDTDMKSECEIYLAINEDGGWTVSNDSASDATEQLVENYGGAMVRVVKITALVTPPVLVEATVDVADDMAPVWPLSASASFEKASG